jgi:hypothetical protein
MTDFIAASIADLNGDPERPLLERRCMNFRVPGRRAEYRNTSRTRHKDGRQRRRTATDFETRLRELEARSAAVDTSLQRLGLGDA